MRALTKPQALLTLLLVCWLAPPVLAQSGVSEGRMSLPEGPGSLEGVGENVDINANMGTMSYSVSIPVPGGYSEMTPGVGLVYNSGGGNSLLGVGWDMPAPSIERMTSRGLPEYTDDDLFAADGGTQLVQVSDGEPAIYRARFEGGFVRYKWFERGTGAGGYWMAEMPDGMVAYYGATEAGDEVAAARVGGRAGVFRYHLVEKVDVYGHRIRFTYRKLGTATVPVEIGYVFVEDEPRFKVTFEYEDRPDHITDLKGGFVEVLESRLATVRVLSGGVQLGRWALSYEPTQTSGGMSRLARIERFGLRDTLNPTVFQFQYSRSLGALCEGEDCALPYLVEMSRNLGINFQSGDVTLVDINGDALPDILHTPVDEPHRFFINRYTTERQSFDREPLISGVGDASTHLLRAGNVQALDVNGDGFADLLNTRTGNVLVNEAGGDWARLTNLFDSPQGLPDLGGDIDPDDGDLETIRFFDHDNDKRIDILKSSGQGDSNQTAIFRNLPRGGFESVSDIEPIGEGFESERLQLTDMNGDGLLDVVLMNFDALSYRLNLGHGRWTGWSEIGALPFTAAELLQVEMEDLNNDGLADMVLVQPDRVRYSLGINGTGFGNDVVIDTALLGAPLPERDNTTTVLFADMNGNGSSDVVWTTLEGDITYLEMFTVQPNLLSRIDNNLGFVQTVDYGSSVEQAARDAEAGRPWSHKLPHAMTVVTRTVTVEAFANLPDETRYRYTEGYYDGAEKAFRGFGHVEMEVPGGDTGETSLKTQRFDLGQGDPHRAGLRLELRHQGEEGRLLRIERDHHEACPIEGLPPEEALDFPIRHVCLVRNETVAVEGNPEINWVTVSVEYEYDGFGNTTLERFLGVTDVGGGRGCEPCDDRPEGVMGRACGPQCIGDEQYRETEYVHPDNTGGRWILQAPTRVLEYGRPGSPRVSERRIYYDGAAFEGLPLGQLTRGSVSRATQRQSDESDPIEVMRFRRDAHGNVIEELNPNGAPEITERERRSLVWDPLGLNPLSIEVFLVDERGEPYSMRQEVAYDDLWNKLSTVIDWVVFRDGHAVTPPKVESVVYDEFGRFDERFLPGDNSGDPSERLTYELQAPISRVVFNTRVENGRGALDKISVRCFDGKGRKIQERTQLSESSWLVSEYTVYNSNGTLHRVYTAHTSDTGDCNAAPPEGTGYKEISYDALDRQVRSAWVTPEGTATERFVHGPTTVLRFDYEDSDPESPHFDTPTRYDYDGLGRRVGVARFTAPNEAETFGLTYDELGNFRGVIGPRGYEKIQTYDDAGRLVRVQDPDRGDRRIERDANSNVIREIDAAGRVIEQRFDSLGRLTARWDAADPEGTGITQLYDFPRSCPAERCTHTASQLVEATFPEEGGTTGGEWFGYSLRAQMTFHGQRVRGRTFEYLFEYDNLDRVTQRTFPDNTSVAYEWDTLRLVAIPGLIEAFDYGDNGLISAIRYANGVTEARHYDRRLRLTDQVTSGPSGVLMSRGYGYDKVGNLTEVRDDRPVEGMASAEARYRYDNLMRLGEAHLDPGRVGFDELLEIGYDDLDNITRKNSSLGDESAAHVGAYTYGGSGPHALTQAGEVSMSYDATGNMVRRGAHGFTWDAFGRIAAASRDGEVVVQNSYGVGFQRLLKETEARRDWTLTEHFEIRDGVASIHILDGPRRLVEIETLVLAPLVLSDIGPLKDEGAGLVPDSDGEITVADAWVSRAVEVGVAGIELGGESPDPVAHLLGAAVARLLTQEGQKTFYHADLPGVAMATDEEGSVIGRAVYYPFGQERATRGTFGDHGYGNKELDRETGTLNFGARHLDPRLGRWLSPDPAFRNLSSPELQHVAEETGAYVAMANNPTSNRDDSGMFIGKIFEAGDSVAGAVFGAITGGVSGAWNSYQEMRIQGYDGWVQLQSALLGGLTGAATGAANGAISGMVSGAITIGVMSAVEFAGARAGDGGMSPQNRITTRRITSAAVTFAIGAALAIAVIATGGLALGVIALVGVAVVLGAKLWAIKKAHGDGFSKAMHKHWNGKVSKHFKKLLAKPYDQVVADNKASIARGGKVAPWDPKGVSTNANAEAAGPGPARKGKMKKFRKRNQKKAPARQASAG